MLRVQHGRRLPVPCTPRLLAALQETLQWLANPANLNSDLLPPGLESFDPLPFLSSTGNVFLVTLLPQARLPPLLLGHASCCLRLVLA